MALTSTASPSQVRAIRDRGSGGGRRQRDSPASLQRQLTRDTMMMMRAAAACNDTPCNHQTAHPPHTCMHACADAATAAGHPLLLLLLHRLILYSPPDLPPHLLQER